MEKINKYIVLPEDIISIECILRSELLVGYSEDYVLAPLQTPNHALAAHRCPSKHTFNMGWAWLDPNDEEDWFAGSSCRWECGVVVPKDVIEIVEFLYGLWRLNNGNND